MKKRFRFLVITFILLILLVGCGTPPQNTNFKIDNDLTISINQTYDGGSVKYTIEKIHILKSDKVQSKNKFDLIQIDSYAKITEDDIYWTPKNSTMTINGSQKTVPMYMDSEPMLPLQKNDKMEIHLIAPISETTVDRIQSITWHITQPVIRDENKNWMPKGNSLDINIVIKKG